MSIDHNRIKVADLEKNEPNKILSTNGSGELEFNNINDIIPDQTVFASDAETQITTVVTEDKKAVSRVKLFNWWNWIKSLPLQWNNTIKASPATQPNELVTKAQLDALDGNTLHKTGNESFIGIKSSTNTGTSQINGFLVSNSGTTTTSYGYSSVNTNSGSGIISQNTGIGRGIYSINNSTGVGIRSENLSTGTGILSNQTSTGTGYNFVGQNNGSTTFSVDKTGNMSLSDRLFISTETSDPLFLDVYSSNPTIGTAVRGQRYYGVKGSPTGVLSNAVLFGVFGAGYDGTIMSAAVGAIRIMSKANFSGTSTPTYIEFATTQTGNIGRLERMRVDDNGDLLIGSITNTGLGKLQVNGTITATVGTNANQVVVNSQLTALDSSALHKTGDETFTGLKSSVNSGTTSINGLNLQNTGSSSTQVLYVNNTAAGRGALFQNGSTGTALVFANNGTGTGIFVQNGSSGFGINSSNSSTGAMMNLNSETSSTGDLITFRKNNVLTSKFDQDGILTTPAPIINTIPITSNPILGGFSMLTRNNTTGQVERSTIIGSYTNANSDITSLVAGTNYGTWIKGANTGHIVMTIDGNDSNDSFNILSNTSTVGNEPMTTNIFKVLRDGKTTIGNGVNISSADTTDVLTLSQYSDNITFGAGLIGNKYAGTKAAPTGILANTVLTGIYGAGYDGSSMSLNVGALRIISKTAFTSTSRPVYIDFSTTPANSLTRLERMRIDDNGDLLVGTITNNGLGKLQVNGNITATAGTDASHVVVNSQLTTQDATTLHKTGNESFTGLKQTTNTGTTQQNGFRVINNGTGSSAYGFFCSNDNTGVGYGLTNNAAGVGLRSDNLAEGQGIYSNNVSTGRGIYSTNSATGQGIYSNNASSGAGIYATNSGTGQSIYAVNNSSGIGIRSDNTGTGAGILSNQSATGSGFNYIGQNIGVNTFTVDKLGSIIGNAIQLNGETANTLASFNGSKSVVALPTTTNPNLTEITYVKGVTSPIQVQLDSKSPLTNPVLTGIPAAPTALSGTNTTQIATTAFVQNAIGSGNANSVLLTSNQTIAGVKTFTNSSASAVLSINTIAGTSPGLQVSVNGTGTAAATFSSSNFATPLIAYCSGSNARSAATFQNMGDLGSASILTLENIGGSTNSAFIRGLNNTGTPIFSVNKTADVTANSFNKTGGTASEFLMANGSIKTDARPYKSYVARLDQIGTAAPIATILENSLGDTVVWTRNSVGVYTVTLGGGFTGGKTVCYITLAPISAASKAGFASITSSYCQLATVNSANVAADDILNNSSIEIRVYN